MNNRNNFINGFKIFLAISLGLLLFYLRLVPRTARDLWENITHKQLFLILFTISLIIINIYTICKTWGYIKTKENHKFQKINEYFSRINKIIIDSFLVFFESLLYGFQYIAENLFNERYFYYNSLRYFLIYTNKKEYHVFYSIMLLTMTYLPKIIMLLAIVVDVFFYHCFDYTFRCIPLLLVPLIPKIIIFVLNNYYDNFYESIFSIMEKHPSNEPNKVKFCFKPEFQENPPFFVQDFHDYFRNHYLVLVNLKRSLETFDNLTNRIKIDTVMLFLMICRLLVYIYILIYGLM